MVQRFWNKVVQDANGCWQWTGCVVDTGYGQIATVFGVRGAHRFAWELLVGPIPSGLVVDHLCRVRHCVNPGHMELVTQRENIRRGSGPTAVNAAKSHCRAGHPLRGSNLYVKPNGNRQCRACHRVAQARYHERNKRLPS